MAIRFGGERKVEQVAGVSVLHVHDWDDLVSQFEVLSGWVFRGEASAEHVLTPSLYRYAVAVELSQAEGVVVYDARRRCHNFLPTERLPNTELEWLALIQHFGGPTRLLDWTASPFVAAFFALENATDRERHCAVWAVDPFWCRDRSAALIAQTHNIDPQLSTKLSYAPGLLDEVFRLATNGAVTACLPVEPNLLHERLIIQQGLFLCPLNLGATFMQNLRAGLSNDQMARHVVKLVVPNQIRPYALSRLSETNISRATLFPGLEGYIQSLRHLIVRETPEDMQNRAIKRALMNDSPLSAALHQEVKADPASGS